MNSGRVNSGEAVLEACRDESMTLESCLASFPASGFRHHSFLSLRLQVLSAVPLGIEKQPNAVIKGGDHMVTAMRLPSWNKSRTPPR